MSSSPFYDVGRDPLTGRKFYGMANIRDLVEYGRRQVHAGHYKGLRFEVFNEQERDQVHQCMDACPNIPYSVQWIDFK